MNNDHINDSQSLTIAINNALTNPYLYLGISANAIEKSIFDAGNGNLFQRVIDFAEDAAANRIDIATRTLQQAQLYNELSQGLSQHLTGLKNHLDVAAQHKIDVAISNLEKANILNDIAIDNKLNLRELTALAKGAGGMLSAIQLASSLQNGSTNEVLKATTGVAVGLVVGIIFPPGLIGIGAGLVAGLLVDIIWDTLLAPEIDPNLNFWDSLFDSLGLNPATSDKFKAASTLKPPKVDPLVFDLDGDGIETTGISETNPIMFDVNADGVATSTGWVSADDALLALDRNGNGTIDNGAELFGDATPLSAGGVAVDGFDALADLDSNSDGVIDANDTEFANLRLWRDLNQDGVSQSNELFTLAALNVASINVASTEHLAELANGNQLADLGTYTKTDGTNSQLGSVQADMADINLIQDTFTSQFTDTLDTTGFENLPSMQGSGMVRNLREAATLSTDLAELIEDYAAAATYDDQIEILDDLLVAWARTSTMNTTFTGAFTDHTFVFRMVDPVQPVYGPGSSGSTRFYLLSSNYSEEALIQQLTELPPVAEQTPWEREDYQRIPELIQFINRLDILESFNGRTFLEVPENDADGITEIGIWSGNEKLLDDSYNALSMSVYLGLVLQTRFKPLLDLIELVIDEDGVNLDFTALQAELDARLANNGLDGLRDNIDFNLAIRGMLHGTSWDAEANLIDLVNEFYEDTTLTSSQKQAFQAELELRGIFRQTNHSSATTENTDFDDIIIGTSSNEVDIGKILGGEGDDVLAGLGGNDYLDGGEDNDLYIFEPGFGKDTISNYDSDTNHIDTIRFRDIQPEDIHFEKINNNLKITITNLTDTVVIKDYFYGPAYQIDRIEFVGNIVDENNTPVDLIVWDKVTIDAQHILMNGDAQANSMLGHNGGPNSIYGFEGADTIVGGNAFDYVDAGSGADYVSGQQGDDSIFGGDGSDILYGNDGNDTLEGGVGTDTLEGGEGADTYIFKQGYGKETINNNEFSNSHVDKIVFDGLTAAEVSSLTVSGSDLLIEFGSSDSVRVVNHFLSPQNYAVDIYQFDDASYTLEELYQFYTINLTSSSDNIVLSDIAESLDAGEGNDTIYAGGGDDFIQGQAGADYISGDNGDDTLSGGTGNDTIFGGNGSDSYVFSAGDGKDTIYPYDYSANPEGVDTLVLHDIDPANVVLEKKANDLLIKFLNSSDSILIVNYYNGFSNSDQFSQIIFDNQVVWDRADINAAPQQSLGTSSADNLTGVTNSPNQMYGYDGDDALIGGASNDTLDGGAGNDVLNSGSASDVIFGQSGNDYLSGGQGDDSLDGGQNADTIYGGSGNDTIIGGVGSDSLIGDAGNDTYVFSHGDGSDTIDTYDGVTTGRMDVIKFLDVSFADVTGIVRSNNDLVINYGVGNSIKVINQFLNASYYGINQYQFTDVTLTGNEFLGQFPLSLTAGDDVVTFVDGAYKVLAGNGNDQINGGTGSEWLLGQSGNDSLYGGIGNDTLEGGVGADMLQGGAGNDTFIVRAGDGYDTISAYDTTAGRVDTLKFDGILSTDLLGVRKSGNLLILDYGTTDSVRIQDYFSSPEWYGPTHFQFDNTTLTRSQLISQYTIKLTANDDTVTFVDANIAVKGQAGNDTLTATYGSNKMEGEDGNDYIITGAGNDSLLGGAGNDTLDGGAGNDVFEAGAGTDIMYSGTGNDTFIVRLGDGYDSISSYDSNLSRTDKVIFEGIASTDLIGIRKGGNTLVLDYSATDSLRIMEYFSDPVNYGVTHYQFSDITLTRAQLISQFALKLSANDDTTTLADSNLNVLGLAGNDTITANNGNNKLQGDDGNDSLTTGNGADTLMGGAGNDTLSGGGGSDSLDGGTGVDYLYGGAGNDWIDSGESGDTVYGEAGQDIFHFSSLVGSDTIGDFSVADDTIYLKNTVFTAFAATGTIQSGTLRSGAGLTTAQDADDYLIYNSTNGALYYDADGSGTGFAAVKIAQLTSAPVITSADFMIV